MNNLENLVKGLSDLMIDFHSFKAKNRVFEYDHQLMNTFEFVKKLKNGVRPISNHLVGRIASLHLPKHCCSSFTIFNSVSISKTLCIVCRHLPQQMPVLASCEEGAPRGIGTTFKRLLQSGTARKRKASGENTVLPHATFEAVT